MPRRRDDQEIKTPKFGVSLRYGNRRYATQTEFYATEAKALEAAAVLLNEYRAYNDAKVYLCKVMGTLAMPVVPAEFTPIGE